MLEQPNNPWGQGEDASRSDAKLMRQAIKNGWPIPQVARKRGIQVARDLMDDPDATDRDKIAAVKLLIEADKINLALAKEPTPAGDTTNNTLNINVHGTVGISGAIEQAKRLIAEFRASQGNGELAEPAGENETDQPSAVGTPAGPADGGTTQPGG